ncbi:MAG: 2-hydroxyacid dehydrogenase [Actinomycetota bacterium]|nr:2-hydroxyacid dehydrogenase [Actinomycetota bacterium]
MSTVCLPSEAMAAELPAGVKILIWTGHGDPPEGIEDTEFLVGEYMAGPLAERALARMPNLRVIQLLSAGVEPWLPLVPDGVTLCNGRGVHGGSTAELAVAGLLSLLRELPHFHDEQHAGRWSPSHSDDLDGKRVLILGAGDIGRRVAAAVRVFDAVCTFVARSARDGIRAIDELPTLLPEHDIVVVSLPHTDETHHLVDARFLAALPDGAMVVNISRGTIVDTDALLAELEAGRLSAFLDVTDPEPLPADHPLWRAPNVLITPHVGGGTTGWAKRGNRLVREQIARFVAGEDLVNVVGDSY